MIRATNEGDVFVGLIEGGCGAAICSDSADRGIDGDTEELVVTIGPDPFEAIVNIDSFGFSPLAGDLVLEVIFSDELPSVGTSCTVGPDTCTDGELTSCVGGTEQTTSRCEIRLQRRRRRLRRRRSRRVVRGPA